MTEGQEGAPEAVRGPGAAGAQSPPGVGARADAGPGGSARDTPPQVIVLTGPTASGKESVAYELSRLVGGEIVSLDSMKVYRELDVGTAKPSHERRTLVRYHLLDLRDPSEDFSVAEYLPLLQQTITEITARGKTPILCGGTALYLKAFLEGFQKGPAANWELRQRLIAEAETKGPGALHAALAARDPVTAAKIHPNDVRRIVRATEVLETTGQPLSREWAWTKDRSLRPGLRLYGLGWPREELYRRIDRRVDRMVAAGLFEEAARLRRREPPLSRSASQSIGYKEIWAAEGTGASESEIVARIQQGTRRFAKSQLTWFRKLPIDWIEVSGEPDSRQVALDIRARSGLAAR